jgi:hypothetical protein
MNKNLTIKIKFEFNSLKIISSDKNYSQFNNFLILGLEIYEITSKKSHSLCVFQQNQNLISISLKLLDLFLLTKLFNTR